MSRKNKNNDPFNMSYEEAEKTADLINELVKGNSDVSIDDIINVDNTDVDDKTSSFTQQLLDFIISKETDDPSNGLGNATVINQSLNSISPADEPVDLVVPLKPSDLIDSNVEEAPEFEFHKIDINWNAIFNLLEITDGEIINYMDLDEIKRFNPFNDGDCDLSDIVSGDLDDDEAGAIYSELFYYIISKKLPSLIIDSSEFELTFSIFSKVNNKYVFFKKDNYILVYIIEKDVYDKFYNYLGLDSDFIPIEVIKAMVNVAKEIEKSKFKLDFGNDDLIKYLLDFSKIHVNNFFHTVCADSESEYAGHQSFSSDTAVYKHLRVLNYDEFVSSVETKLNNKTEQESDIVDNEPGDELIINDYPDISEMVDDKDSLLKTEPPRVIEPVKPNNSQNMTIPVFRKKK